MPDDGAWTAPGSGRPVNPADVAAPNPGEIADRIVRRLVVPRGPVRAVSVLLGAGPGNNVPAASVFNAAFTQAVLAGPGIIRAIDAQFTMRTTAASGGMLQLVDGTGDIVKAWPVSLGAAAAINSNVVSAPAELPFLQGLNLVWTPLTANGVAVTFISSLIAVNIDYESIPIGQRTYDNA